MPPAPQTRRRWLQFGFATIDRSGADIDEPRNKVRADDTNGPGVERHVAHTIEDVLVGIAIVALAFDDQFPRDVVQAVVRGLMEARHEGRASELVAAAYEETETLPDWECIQCRESNPATFAICWNCSSLQPPGCAAPSKESQIILSIESAGTLRSGRESDSGDPPHHSQFEDEHVENHQWSSR
jgi:hypothetical protein